MLFKFLFVAFCIEIVYLLFFNWLVLDSIHLICKLSKCAIIKKKFIVVLSLYIFVLISFYYFFCFLSVIMMR